MDVPVGSLITKGYQLEDLINILLNNNYKVEIESNDENSVLVTIYKNFNKKESEEK